MATTFPQVMNEVFRALLAMRTTPVIHVVVNNWNDKHDINLDVFLQLIWLCDSVERGLR